MPALSGGCHPLGTPCSPTRALAIFFLTFLRTVRACTSSRLVLSSPSMSPAEQLEALKPLIDFHARRVVGPAFPYVDRRDMEQDAAVAILQRAARFDGSTQLETFHERRIRGAMIDGLRRWHNKRPTLKHGIEWMPFEARYEQKPDAAPSVETRVIKAEQETQVVAALAILSASEAYVIRRAFFEEASYDEIASELQRVKSRVYQLRRSALNKLRSHLDAAA